MFNARGGYTPFFTDGGRENKLIYAFLGRMHESQQGETVSFSTSVKVKVRMLIEVRTIKVGSVEEFLIIFSLFVVIVCFLVFSFYFWVLFVYISSTFATFAPAPKLHSRLER